MINIKINYFWDKDYNTKLLYRNTNKNFSHTNLKITHKSENNTNLFEHLKKMG